MARRQGADRLRRILYPALVGACFCALWQALVTGLDLPPYVVPSPALMVKTLFLDWGTLGPALLVTVRITLLAFVLATLVGAFVAFLFVQSRFIEAAFFPLRFCCRSRPSSPWRRS